MMDTSVIRSNIKARLLMLGLDAAGKTTIIYKLRLGEVITTIPTIGFNVENVESGNINITAWDVGGPDKIRPLWRHYYQNTNIFVFVIDSNDKERLYEAANELSKALDEDELKDAVVLIIANKQDLPNAMTPYQMAVELGLRRGKNSTCVDISDLLENRYWCIQPCCAITGDGLYEAFDWACQALSANI